MSGRFVEERFLRQVEKALTKAKTVLDINKHPQLPADIPHGYSDKYLLAECVVNLGVSAQVTALEAMGVTPEILKQVLGMMQKNGRSVTLRMKAEHRCEYDREETREEEGNTEYVTKLVGVFKRTDKVVTTIVEHFWNFSYTFDLFLFEGNDVDNGIKLQSRSAKHEIKTLSKEEPRPKVKIYDPLDLNLTWLLQNINADTLGSRFSIQRGHKNCHTPRRNEDVSKALRFFQECEVWGENVYNYFTQDLFESEQPHGLNISAINVETIFLPVVPLFEKKERKPKKTIGDDGDDDVAAAKKKSPRVVRTAEEGGFGMMRSSLKTPSEEGGVVVSYVGTKDSGSSPLLSEDDLDLLLVEQKRSIEEKRSALKKEFPDDVKLITNVEAMLAVLGLHEESLALCVFDGLDYVEDMLRQQLVAAIGKEVLPEDFASYMQFHNRKIFKEEYRPKPFAYAVRRPGYCPEGIVSLEQQMDDGGIPQPVQTIVCRSELKTPLQFSIHAAAKITLKGEVLVHGYMGHQFSGQTGTSLSLSARARQFSSFLVLVGRITGPGLFDPTYGMIVKDKDDITIPLRMETIPSAKEFKKAISSLSPEQQRFAKAYRGMQLSSTLFGVCVIQIKPQLEKLLKLPDDSLTKEIEMTQNILELFQKYQVPSDLLSYDYTDGRPKVPAVEKNVQVMMEMIADAKKQEVKDAITQSRFDGPPSPPRIVRNESSESSDCDSFCEELEIEEEEEEAEGFFSKVSSFIGSALRGSTNGAPVMEGAMDDAVMTKEEEAGESMEPAEEKKAQDENQGDEEKEFSTDAIVPAEADDFLLLPKMIESALEANDPEGAVRPTIIHVEDEWAKRSQADLLADVMDSLVDAEDQKLEKEKCYDLLDALTKSGGLAIDGATMHIVLAATHCFDKSVLETLVQENVNPIQRVERSNVIMASAIHKIDDPTQLLKKAEAGRIKGHSPQIFLK